MVTGLLLLFGALLIAAGVVHWRNKQWFWFFFTFPVGVYLYVQGFVNMGKL